MGNIKFSADMVGIQTLAQQGIAAPQSDSVLAFNGGSFEDMILQMISNNLTIDEHADVNSENVQQIVDVLSGMVSKDENDENALSGDALYNMLNPDALAQLMAMYNVQPLEFGNISDQLANAVAEVNTIENVSVADINGGDVQILADNVQMNISQEIKANESSTVIDNYSKSDEVEENVLDINALKNNTVKTEDILNDIKSAVSGNIQNSIVEKTSFEGKAKNNDTAMFDADADMNFVSTADMLQLRSGGKVELTGSQSLFKVAEMPIDIESNDAALQLADRILMKFNENEFEVELYPKSLGKIAIKLILDNDVVRVAMSGSNDKVNEFLASQSANIQSIVEKNTQYQAVVKLDDSQAQYQQQRDNTQQSADESQRERQQEHLQRMYQQSGVQHTEDFLSMLKLV